MKDGKVNVVANDGTKSEINAKDGAVTVKSDDGKSQSQFNIAGENEALTLPKDFPVNVVPVVDGSKVKSSFDTSTEGKKNVSVTLSSDKNAADVYKFYEDKLKDIKNPAKVQLGEGYTIAGEKDGYGISVIISKTEEAGAKSLVIISMEQKQ